MGSALSLNSHLSSSDCRLLPPSVDVAYRVDIAVMFGQINPMIELVPSMKT